MEEQEQKEVDPPKRTTLALSFTGNEFEYTRLWFLSLALTILTLGAYSAWSKVRLKQYIHRNTWLEGDNFDYVAEPLSILRGRAVVALILVGLWVAEAISLYASILSFVALFLAFPWVFVKARQFELHNTTYRGLRFGYVGSVGKTYREFTIAGLPALFTLGLASFYFHWRLTAYALNFSRYGNVRATWHTSAGTFLGIYSVTGLYFGLAGFTGSLLSSATDVPLVEEIFGYVLLLPISAYFRVSTQNATYRGLRIAGYCVHSEQRTLALFGIYLTNAIAVVLTLGLALPWSKIRTVRYRIKCLKLKRFNNVPFERGTGSLSPDALGSGGADIGGLDLGIG